MKKNEWQNLFGIMQLQYKRSQIITNISPYSNKSSLTSIEHPENF